MIKNEVEDVCGVDCIDGSSWLADFYSV